MKTLLSNRLSFPTRKGYLIVSSSEIIHCQSDGNYSSIYLVDNKQLLICRQLGYLETILPEDYFLRVHHSHIVNTLFLKKYLHEQGGQLVMANGTIVPVSRRKKQQVIIHLRMA